MNMNDCLIKLLCCWRTSESHYSAVSVHILKFLLLWSRDQVKFSLWSFGSRGETHFFRLLSDHRKCTNSWRVCVCFDVLFTWKPFRHNLKSFQTDFSYVVTRNITSLKKRHFTLAKLQYIFDNLITAALSEFDSKDSLSYYLAIPSFP